MKQWLNKITVLVWREILSLARTYKGILLLVIIIALGIFSQLIERSGTQTERTFLCPQVLFVSYSGFLQLFPLALAIILADAISGEKERGTWNFFISKPLTEGHLLISKIFVYCIFISLAIVLMWAGVMLFAYNIKAESTCKFEQTIFPLITMEAVAFAIVALEIMISAMSRRISVAVLLIIAGWLLVTIMNMATPIGRGFLAPWAANSYQTSVIVRLLNLGFAIVPFEYSKESPTVIELWMAILTPIIEGVLFCGIAWVMLKLQRGAKR